VRRKADRIHLRRERVARLAEPVLERPEEEAQEDDPLRRVAASLGNRAFAILAREGVGVLPGGRVHPDVETTIARTRGGGTALDPHMRGRFGPGLGDELGHVRLHTDETADALARSVAARAFTTGTDIYFAKDEFSPGTADGESLLEHELTHVVQQRDAPTAGPLVASEPGDPHEVEAEAVGEATRPGASQKAEADVAGLQRETATEAAPAATAEDKAKAEAAFELALEEELKELELSDKAKKAAQELKRAFREIVFTSGKRDTAGQASAMAENIVVSGNRNWIKETYAASTATTKLQKWVDENDKATTKDAIAEGLQKTMDAMTESERRLISKHLTGDAFDVQPVEKDADKIKDAMKKLPGVTKFFDKEGDLVRWHVQF